MKNVAARIVSKRMEQQAARIRIAGLHQILDVGEVLARLFLGPTGACGRPFLQPEGAVVGLMADRATSMPCALLQKYGLDLGTVDLEIQGLCPRALNRASENAYRGRGDR